MLQRKHGFKRAGIVPLGVCTSLVISCTVLASEVAPLQLPSTQVDGVQSSADDTDYRAGYSSTADKTETAFLQQSQTVDTVTPQQLKDQAPQTLEDVIKFMPGVVVSNNFGGTQDSFIKRGFGNSDDGGVLRDGVRMPIGRNFQRVTTERVEMLKGPASLLYGMQEPGGVINVITKKPQYQWNSTLGGTLSDQGGGDGWFDVTGPLGDTGFAFRLIGQNRDENYWRNFGQNTSRLVAPSLAYESDDLSFLAAYEYNDYSNTLDRGAVFYNGHHVGSRDKRLDEKWTRAQGQRQSFNTTTEYRLDPASRVRLTTGWVYDHYNDYQADPSEYRPATGELTRRFRRNVGANRENAYLSLDWIGSRTWHGIDHDLVTGVDYETRREANGDFLQSRNVGGFYPADPQYGLLPPTGTVNPSNTNGKNHIKGQSLYVKDTVHLGEKWILAPGLRYQHYSIDSGAGLDFKQTTDEGESRLLPFLGLVYQMRDDLSAYANYSQSFAPNEMESGTTFEGTYKAETGRQYEVGLKYDNGDWTSQLALYDILKKNVQQNTGELDEFGNMVQRLAGEVQSRGLEWSMTGRLSAQWSVIANYAYTDARIKKDTEQTEGNRLFNVARHVGGAYLTYEVPADIFSGRLRLGSGARYVGKRAGDISNSFELPGYTTVDAFVSWKSSHLLGKETSLQLNAGNLTDRSYFVASGGNTRRVSWGEGRTLRLTGEVSF